MSVIEFLHRQKYWTPVTITYIEKPGKVVSTDYDGGAVDRWQALADYGGKRVKYFYFATDHHSQPWKFLRKFRMFKELFFRINPQRLYIEVYNK